MELAYERFAGLFEREVAAQAAPTLAGAKPASMFTVPALHCMGRLNDGRQLMAAVAPQTMARAIAAADARLAPHGVRICALANRPVSTLAFVWRPQLMAQYLTREPVASLLDLEGYDVADAESCMDTLALRMADFDACPRDCATGQDRFPHEVGFFLGYPVDDVLAFVRQRCQGMLMRGYWNVYSQPERARDVFRLFDDCTARCIEGYACGLALEELACAPSAVREDLLQSIAC